ncbi:hypothetical protein P8452_20542 [Trifolium repens]|nr:hypothetical protein P8452_20542 [Trifolium repens]
MGKKNDPVVATEPVAEQQTNNNNKYNLTILTWIFLSSDLGFFEFVDLGFVCHIHSSFVAADATSAIICCTWWLLRRKSEDAVVAAVCVC